MDVRALQPQMVAGTVLSMFLWMTKRSRAGALEKNSSGIEAAQVHGGVGVGVGAVRVRAWARCGVALWCGVAVAAAAVPLGDAASTASPATAHRSSPTLIPTPAA